MEPITLRVGTGTSDTYFPLHSTSEPSVEVGKIRLFENSTYIYVGPNQIALTGRFTIKSALDAAQRFADLLSDVTE